MSASPRNQRVLAYLTGLVLALATALPSYISSTYLAEHLGERRVGLVYSLAALLTLILLSLGPWLLRQFELRVLILIGGILASLAVITVGTNKTVLIIIGAFTAFYALGILLRFFTDFYLEEVTSDSGTGKIRGFFLTLVNLGWLLSPIAATLLLTNGGYRLLYIASGMLFMPLGLLVITHHQTKRLSPNHKHWWPTLVKLVKNHNLKTSNLRHILMIDLWLNTFYAIMVVYLPIFLHQHIGLSWPAIGVIFTWMLLPFVLIEYPLGLLADNKYGEQEILIFGLTVAGIFTLIIPWLNLPHILSWSVLLLLTRVGAASIEIMKETYLFKKIGATDTDILSLSRSLIPISYLVTPLAASIVLIFLPIHFLFALLGLSALLMIPIAQKLRDTK